MVRIIHLTYLTYELNGLVDREYSIPMKETLSFCEQKTIFEELGRRFTFKEAGLDLSLLKNGERKELADTFQERALAGEEREHYNVENNGLCLLIAYAQELINQEAKKLVKK
jgi:hypothetical protein